MPKRKVCLFGLSANPPTGKGGHFSFISYLASLKRCDHDNITSFTSSTSTTGRDGLNTELLFDEVRVLPVYKHMFSSKQDQASYDHRMEMCKLAFKDIPNVQVSDQERLLFEYIASQRQITSNEEKIKLRLGTSNLLDYLLEKNKINNIEEEFTLAMGADTFMDLTSYKWRRPKDIIQMVEGRFIVKLRNTGDSEDKREILERISKVNADLEQDKLHTRMDVHLITEEISSVSSTAARSTSDEEKLSMHLDQSIINYIKVNKLYKFSSN